jgi:hypothetical protein
MVRAQQGPLNIQPLTKLFVGGFFFGASLVPGFDCLGWWELPLIMVLFHEIHSNLMRSPYKYNKFEISNFDQEKTSSNMMKNQLVRNRG